MTDRDDKRAQRAWIFDLDNTLYPRHTNLFAQIDVRMKAYISRLLGLDSDAAHALQKRYYHEHGTTLHGLMRHHGVDADDYLDYVHDIDVSVVPPSPELDRALEALAGPKFVYTNGSTAHAERVIARLGIGHHFRATFDIRAADYVPKPDPRAYRRMVGLHGIEPTAAVMVEDMLVNLEPARAMGMTTVWVRAAEAAGPVPDHVDHHTDDLAGWLAEAGATLG